MKETNVIVRYCLILFLVVGLYYMYYKDLISGGMFCIWAICIALIFILDIVKRKRSVNKTLLFASTTPLMLNFTAKVLAGNL